MRKHTAVFVFDEELKTIIVESVDGVRYVPEKPTVTTAHSSLVIKENQTPDEQIMPFELQTWLDSNYIRVETRVGKEVMFLHNLGVTEWPLVGWIEGGTIPTLWREDGRHSETSESAVDLFLIVKQ